MASKRGKKNGGTLDVATEQFDKGYTKLAQHPMFMPLLTHASVIRSEGNHCPPAGWAVVTSNGQIHVHPTRRALPEQWIYVLAHSLLHLGFGHFQSNKRPREWNVVGDLAIAKFLADLKLGQPPVELPFRDELAAHADERLYQEFCEGGVPDRFQGFGMAGPGHNDMLWQPERTVWYGHKVDWQECFGQGLAAAVTSAVKVVAGREPFLGADKHGMSMAQAARAWFISSYPLLGSLAATFEIVEDPLVCTRLGISIAAVNPESKEIFINPAAGLDQHECRFVMAHELLHVGLSHSARRQGRDHYLWNVACDYVINGWLVEMGLGNLPRVGALYDPSLKAESAEAIYDRIVTDMRRYRRLATLRGVGLGDMLDEGTPDWWAMGDGSDLDDFYRRCLSQGLIYHAEQGRGLLPAGLIEEIRALGQPPIPWDVELAKWFDNHFAPLEKVRSYARPSRRQSSTPDIPRPRWIPEPGAEDGRTFGVILDTSGSMDRELLAKALGAIASYSMSREVPAVRVIFCDAATYDQGYMPPEAIADRVKIKGRGGTILQPGIDLLETAEDFPKDGPLLIITDGVCDSLRVRRSHAFLLPEGRHLPFVPMGEVFRMR
jgi:predicted metal-dependent peptidase